MTKKIINDNFTIHGGDDVHDDGVHDDVHDDAHDDDGDDGHIHHNCLHNNLHIVVLDRNPDYHLKN